MLHATRWRIAVHLGLLILLLLTLLPTTPTHAQAPNTTTLPWQSIGPWGGAVHTVAFAPDYARTQTIFAATAGGIYRSSDAARTWLYMGLGDRGADFEFGVSFTNLALAPNFAAEPLIIASGNSNTFRSPDGGATWATVGQVLSLVHVVFSPNFATDRTIFAADANGNGIYRSNNDGVSWQPVNSGLTRDGRNVNRLAISPNYAADQTVFAATWGDGVYRSTDGGASWSKVSQGVTDHYLSSLVISPAYAADRTLFASSSSAVYRSTDGGTNWARLSSGSGFNPAVYLAISPNFAADATIFATDLEGGVSRSQDGGVTWQGIGPLSLGNLNSGTGFVYLSPNFSNDQTVFATTNTAGYRSAISRNAGTSWEDLGTGLAGTEINAVVTFVDSTNQEVLLAGADGLYRTTDGGKIWQTVLGISFIGIRAISASPDVAVDQTIFAGGPALYRSNDAGRQWRRVESFPTLQTAEPASFVGDTIGNIVVSPAYAADRTIFVATSAPGGNGNVLRSTNDGLNWTAITTGLPTSERFITDLAVSPTFANDNLMLVGVWGHGIYRSTNRGTSWVRVRGLPDGFVDGSVRTLVFSPSFANDRTVWASLGEQLLRSTDAGVTWASVVSGPSGASAVAFSPQYASDRTIYLGTSGLVAPTGAIYQSVDGGQRWSLYAPELNRGRIRALTVSTAARSPMAGTASGLYSARSLTPLELTGFLVDGYIERDQCYDVMVALRNNTAAPITRSISIAEQATYFDQAGQPAALPQGRADRFFDCDAGTALAVNGTINRSLTVPANATATLRLRLRHDWDWIERRTVASSIYSVLSERIKAALLRMVLKESDLKLVIKSAKLYEDLGKLFYEESEVRPRARYRYALQVEGLATQPQRDVEVVVNEFQQGWYRGSFAAAVHAKFSCSFWYNKLFMPGCALAILTSESLYLAAYGEVALLALPANGTGYRELATPQPRTLAVLGELSTPQQRAYVEQHIQVEALQRAALESLRRASAATAAGDGLWALRQRQHARRLLEQAAAQLGAASRQAELLIAGLTPPTAQAISDYQAALQRDGFDATTRTLFSDVGVATADQEALRAELLALAPADWPELADLPAALTTYERTLAELARAAVPTLYLPLVRR
ncbi:MAG: WD40/YVTN/BNR-like repeat-containing protein [Oscillochloridaceae bacterium umkhey_bin13]